MQVEVDEESKRASFIELDSEQRKILPPYISSYDVGSKVGLAGSFGSSTLWLVRCRDEDEDMALYMARKTEIEQLSQEDIIHMQDELKLSTFLNHPCILFSYTSFVDDKHIWSIFPLYHFGSCHDLIAAEFHNGLPILLVSMVLRSVLLALSYLHDLGYIHRAVKGSHILLNSNGGVCLSGLRYCCKLASHTDVAHCFPYNPVPLFPWMAPEVLRQDLMGYTNRADIYSLGITAVELVTGTIPFNKLRPTEILLQKLRGVVPQLPDEAVLEDLHCDISLSSSATSATSLEGIDQTNDMLCEPSLSSVSFSSSWKRVNSLQQFVEVCLLSEYSTRPSAKQLKDCPYIRVVKRKMKDKDFVGKVVDLLKPIVPIRELTSPSVKGSGEDDGGNIKGSNEDSGQKENSLADSYWTF